MCGSLPQQVLTNWKGSKELGADYAVDHRKEDWHKQVRGITKEIAKRDSISPGVDVIFEHIGGSHWNKELTLLKYGATIVTTGATTGYDAPTDLRQIIFQGHQHFRLNTGNSRRVRGWISLDGSRKDKGSYRFCLYT